MVRRTLVTAVLVATIWAIGLGAAVVHTSAEAECGPATLTIHTDACTQLGRHLQATIELTDADSPIVGGQFLLEYNAGRLNILSVRAGDAPFIEIRKADVSTPGLIDYGVVVDPDGGTPTADDAVMARLTFEVLDDMGEPFIRFRESVPATVLVTSEGGQVPRTVDSDARGVDLLTLAHFQTCYRGDGEAASSQCQCLFDYDLDSDVDTFDFEPVQAALADPFPGACP